MVKQKEKVLEKILSGIICLNCKKSGELKFLYVTSPPDYLVVRCTCCGKLQFIPVSMLNIEGINLCELKRELRVKSHTFLELLKLAKVR